MQARWHRYAWVILSVMVLALPLGVMAASSQRPVKITFVLSNPEISAAYAPITSVPLALGYWKDEGLDVEVVPSSGATEALQRLITGRGHFYQGAPTVLMIGKSDKEAAVTAVYQLNFANYYSFAVLPDSPIAKVEDLKGKRVGVQSLGAQGKVQVESFARAAGLDPSRDIELLPVGIGAPAAVALGSRRVDSLFLADLHYAAMKNLGYEFKHFVSPAADQLAYVGIIGASDKFIAENPEATGKFLRGMAKGTVYALANPAAAARLHFRVFPEAKDRTVSEEEAITRGRTIVDARLATARPPAGRKWGEASEASVKLYLDFLAAQGQIKNPLPATRYYTNAFVDASNAFDAKAIETAARGAR